MNLQNILQTTVQAAQEASEKIIMPAWQSGEFCVETKQDETCSPVTEIDRAAERAIVTHLRAAFPNDAFLGEEGANDKDRLTAKHVWIIDPIDGTRSFIKKGDRFSISIARVTRDDVTGLYHPDVAVIYVPVTQRLFTSIKGQGMAIDGQKITRQPSPKELIDQTALISWTEQKKGILKPFEGLFKTDNNPSLAHKLALVAAGEADFMFTLKPKSEWDMAAGHLMCDEMGVIVTDLDNNAITYNLQSVERPHLIAALPQTHNQLLQIIKNK